MKVYQVVDGELISIELSPLAQRMFFHGKKCTSDGFVDYRDAEQKKMHQLAISVGAFELANTVVFGNCKMSTDEFAKEMMHFFAKTLQAVTNIVFLKEGVDGTTL